MPSDADTAASTSSSIWVSTNSRIVSFWDRCTLNSSDVWSQVIQMTPNTSTSQTRSGTVGDMEYECDRTTTAATNTRS